MLVTWAEVGYAVWKTALHPNLEALLISKNATDSREMVRRAYVIWERLAPELGLELLQGRARSQSVFRWANGSRIISLPCVSSAARNRSPAFVGLDEVGYQKDAKGIYHSVQGCMLPHGQLVAISTPNPRKEGAFFRELCKDPARYDFERQDVWPHMHPLKDRAWAASEIRRIGETAFRYEHGLCLDAGGEGQLYAPFSIERHLEDDVVIPEGWKRYRTMDFGPRFACLWVAEGPPVGSGSLGNLVAYRELPLKGLPSSIRARMVRDRSGSENYEFTMSDSADPQARLEMATEGVPSMPCPPKDLLESIWKVKRLFEGDGISSPRLTVSRACPTLIGQLQDLQQDEAGYPLEHQIDDLCFAAETLVVTPFGAVQIDALQEGDVVLTPCGWERILRAGLTRLDAPMVSVIIGGDETTVIRCTPDHRFLFSRSCSSDGDPAGLPGEALLPLRAVLQPWTEGGRARGVTSGGVGGHARSGAGRVARPSQERRSIGQSAVQLGSLARLRAYAEAHEESGACGEIAGVHQESDRSGPGMASFSTGAGVASKTGEGGDREAALSDLLLRGVWRRVREPDDAETTAAVLREQLQDAGVPASPAGVLQDSVLAEKVREVPVPVQIATGGWRVAKADRADAFCLAVPCGAFVLANGLIAKNCDPLRYLVKFLELRARGDVVGTPDVQPEDRGDDREDLYQEMGVGDVGQEESDEFDFDERELGL